MLVHRCEESEENRPAASRKARKCGVWVDEGMEPVGTGEARYAYAAEPKETSARELKARCGSDWCEIC